MKRKVAAKKKRRQLVTFQVSRETYGIDIFKIQEVLHFQKITTIPNAPEFVEGVIQVRNQVIPVVDLKKRLGLTEHGASRKRIVILELGERPLGVIVDDVSKVLLLGESDYEPLPEAVVGNQDRACISRLAKTDDGLVIVIAPERILSKSELAVLREFELEQERQEKQAEDGREAGEVDAATAD